MGPYLPEYIGRISDVWTFFFFVAQCYEMPIYETAISKSHRTNNVSEAWHNRFHPAIYTAIGETQKEQGYTEIGINKLAMGEKDKTVPTKKRNKLQSHLESIANNTTPDPD